MDLKEIVEALAKHLKAEARKIAQNLATSLDSLRRALNIILEFIADVLRESVDITFSGALGISFSREEEEANDGIDQRIAKISEAKIALNEALSAVDSLQKSAERNREDIARMLAELELAKAEKDDLSQKINNLKRIAEADAEEIRKVFNFPTRRERWIQIGVGFVFGIAASLIATGLIELLDIVL